MTTPITPNEVVVMKDPKWASLPHPDVPYFVLNAEGLFLRKQTLFGTATVPFKGMPPSLIIPESKGQFEQNDLRFPGWLVAQVTDFFTKVYDRHKTEAAVIVTYNPRSKQFRVFVPEQYVSHGGVHQRYNPEHLEAGWYAVGTIHSHCNFSAYHSGTDTHDAGEMDGLHMTIGMLKAKDGPQIATMISMNESLFHIKFEQGCNIEDRRDKYGESAPEWWFKYVHTTGRAPWMKPEPYQRKEPVGFQQRRLPDWSKEQPKVTVESKPTDGVRAKNARGEEIIIPRALPKGYTDWQHWWAVNGMNEAKPPTVPEKPIKIPTSSQSELWREEDWAEWWEQALAESELADEIVDEATGPFEKNQKVIDEADELLNAATNLLESAGFRINYSIIWGGSPKRESD